MSWADTSMEVATTERKQYGPVNVGGNARLQQGDNIFHIETAYFGSCQELQPTFSIQQCLHARGQGNVQAVVQRYIAQVNGEAGEESTGHNLKQIRVEHGVQEHDVHLERGDSGQGIQSLQIHGRDVTNLCDRRVRNSGHQRVQGVPQRIEGNDGANSSQSLSLRKRPSISNAGTPTPSGSQQSELSRIRDFLSDLIEKLYDLAEGSRQHMQRSLDRAVLPPQDAVSLPQPASDSGSDGVLSRSYTSSQELAGLCILILCWLASRNVSGSEITRIVSRCQQDRTLPILAVMLGFGIARHIYLGSVARALSGLSGDCIIFEDAFRRERPIAMSTCEHFAILKAFLEVHYQGTTGEAFVRSGHFNLLMGSRRGIALRSNDWSKKGRIKAKMRIVMSVYLTTDEPQCTKCKSTLEISVSGEFYCNQCGHFYRDCNMLEYFREDITASADRSQQGLRPGIDTQHRGDNSDPVARDGAKQAEIEYDVAGLENIDLRVMPSLVEQESNDLPPFIAITVSGFDPHTQLDELTRMFRRYGPIADFLVMTDPGTGELLPIAWILYGDDPAAADARYSRASSFVQAAVYDTIEGPRIGTHKLQVHPDYANQYWANQLVEDEIRRRNLEVGSHIAPDNATVEAQTDLASRCDHTVSASVGPHDEIVENMSEVITQESQQEEMHNVDVLAQPLAVLLAQESSSVSTEQRLDLDPAPKPPSPRGTNPEGPVMPKPHSRTRNERTRSRSSSGRVQQNQQPHTNVAQASPETKNDTSDKSLPERFGTLDNQKSSKSPSFIPRATRTKRNDRVSNLARHFEQLSREFERERLKERRQRAARWQREQVYPIAAPKPVVEVYSSVHETGPKTGTEAYESITEALRKQHVIEASRSVNGRRIAGLSSAAQKPEPEV